MKIEEKDISGALKQYGIRDTLRNTFYLIEHYREGVNPRARVIVKAEIDSNKSYCI